MPFLEENHDAFVLPTSRFNPNGLLTPPESPKFGHVSPPELASTLNSAITREPCNSPQMCRLGSPEAVPQSAQHDLTRVSETIYTIIEQVIEQKLAEAMGPLRLNLRRFDSENTDLGYQIICHLGSITICIMGVTPVKKTPSKTGRSPAHDRRSQSRGCKDGDSAITLLQRTPSHAREPSFSHSLPTEEQKRSNGRVVGRSLIMWGRPRMAEKLLLHLHYECTRHKIVLPWDSIAHRLHPGSSGAAVVQHLNRVRKELIREGHLVPPVCQKPSSNSTVDPNIRGYVRQDLDGDDKDTTRAVRFDERHDDLRFNLPDSFQHSGDEDECMPDSPSPVRIQHPRFCSGPPSTTDESVTNSLRRFEQNWSPMSSFCSPTRQKRSEVDELENPLLTRSFETVTSLGSAPTSAPSTQSQWQEDPWPQYSPMGLYPYAKQHTAFDAPFPGYFTLPTDYSMFPAGESFAEYQGEQAALVDCSQVMGDSKNEDQSQNMAVDENFGDTCDGRN
ncbi:chaperonin GroL [Cordyceps javanica]|uniref:Chaperonin GroL n=1 Tax=Cordyceps javanica TaxID=43265 RepID=A0A545V7C2_9HYPO|nr:chaperonin GroL [Cordyceps javanica]